MISTLQERRTPVDQAGVRRCPIGSVRLENGRTLPDVVLGYRTWGTPNADRSNAILIEHALTGTTDVVTDDDAEPGWWQGLVGPGLAIDTRRWFVVAANILGGCHGSTGPKSIAPDGVPWGSRFPLVTVRDSVRAEAVLADKLGIDRWHAVVGGSLGGMRALEWAVEYPDRVRHCAVIAAGAYSTAEQIAWIQPQLLAIRQDPCFRGGDYYDGPPPVAGLGLARRIAHITYRTETDLEARFSRLPQGAENPYGDDASVAGRERYAIESYLDYQADKLASRFDANSYIAVSETLISHDIRRGRGSLVRALSTTSAEFTIAAISSDRLYLPAATRELAEALPGRPEVTEIGSPYGHDGFLIETDAIGALLAERIV